MPHPHLFQINTWPWLTDLSRRAGRPITLGTVPEAEWDRLQQCGFAFVYLMGLWRRSAVGRAIARSTPEMFRAYEAACPGWTAADVVGSAFSITGYEPDPHLGSFDELAAVRAQLHRRGMRLLVDFIPNHVGFDHPWLSSHPERFVTASEAVYQRAPSEFRPIALPSGAVRFVACARDPFFAPWSDVAQLNYSNPDLRSAMVDVLETIARHADGARCDMAMLALSDVFTRTWAHLAGPAPTQEFWRVAAAAVPDFVLLAEVYWNLEWRLQELGFHYTYDKTLYDRMLRGQVAGVRGLLTADLAYQNRLARFIENHDEPRSSVAFGERATAAAVAMSTLPGLRFFHQGQLEGRRTRVPVQLGASGDEPVDPRLVAFYQRLLAVTGAAIFHDGAWRLRAVAPIDDSSRFILAWEWRLGADRRLVIVNLGESPAQALLPMTDDLDDHAGADRFSFDDAMDGRAYEWRRADLLSGGLYVKLAVGQSHVLTVRPLMS